MTEEMAQKTAAWTEKVLPRLRAEPSGCMVWTGNLFHGYAYVNAKILGRHRSIRIHRLALEVKLGRPLGKMLSLHHCDNRACANPDHLFEGTDNDNRLDAIAKGRSVFGVADKQHWFLNGTSRRVKLTADQVREIRRLHDIGGYFHKDLASMFNVKKATIAQVVNRITWQHIT